MTAYVNHRFLTDFMLIVTLGVFSSLGMIFGLSMQPKWSFSIISAIVFFAVLLAIQQRERFLIYLAVILMSVYMDFHPVFIKSPIGSWPVPGFRISIFDVAFFLLMCSWGFRLVTDRNLRIRLFPILSIPFGIIWLLAIASNGQAEMPLAIKASTLWMVLESWLIFLYFANNIRDHQLLFNVTAAFLVSGAIQSVLGISQYVSHGTLGLEIFGEAKTFIEMRAGAGLVSRVAGTLGHPNSLAGFLNLVILINFGLLFAPLRAGVKLLLVPLIFLLTATLFLTLSRGGWLALGLGGGTAFAYYLARFQRSRMFAVAASVLLVGVFFVSSLALVEPMKRRVFEQDYGAAQSRVPLSAVALNMISNNPWLGVGLTNYIFAASEYDTTAEAISYEFPFPVHNEFLLIAAELGLPVLGLFLFMLAVVFHSLLRLGHSRADPVIPFIAIGLLGSYVAWCVFRMTDYSYTLLADPFWALAGLTMAMTEMLRFPAEQEGAKSRGSAVGMS